MNDSQPVPTHGTVSVNQANLLEPGLIRSADGAEVGARVYVFETDDAGRSTLMSSIVGSTPIELERLSFAIRDAANLLRKASA